MSSPGGGDRAGVPGHRSRGGREVRGRVASDPYGSRGFGPLGEVGS